MLTYHALMYCNHMLIYHTHPHMFTHHTLTCTHIAPSHAHISHSNMHTSHPHMLIYHTLTCTHIAPSHVHISHSNMHTYRTLTYHTHPCPQYLYQFLSSYSLRDHEASRYQVTQVLVRLTRTELVAGSGALITGRWVWFGEGGGCGLVREESVAW